jgi:DNA-binding protein H-NS
MSLISDLIRQKADLEEQILRVQREERAAKIAEIRQTMADYGLTLADLGAHAGAAAPRRAGAGSSGKGAKVEPKYRDAATGQTWSGRGLQPNWLKAELAKGRSLDEFAI